jgi:hypothetical protein
MRCAWPIVLAAAILIASVPLEAARASYALAQGDQGLNGGWAIDDNGNLAFTHSLTSTLPVIHQAGAGWVRIVFRLGRCYSNWTSPGCNGRRALDVHDQVVSNLHSQNLHVLAILTGESWPGSESDWTANNAEWTWTSTDGQGHFSGATYMYPSNYAWLLERSYDAIKSAEPGSHVIFGGLFAHEPFTAQATVTVLVNGRPERVIKRGDTLFPSGGSTPSTSTLSYDSSKYAIANNAIARLGGDGAVCVNVGTFNSLPGQANVVIDVEGYPTP